MQKKVLSSNELKAIHSLELEALTVIDQICRKHSIKYTLIGGSLLAEYNINHGVFIDIFPVDNVSDKESEDKKQFNSFIFLRHMFMAKYLSVKARKGKK